MYKDKEKAKASSRERMRKMRAKGVTSGVTKPQGVTRTGCNMGVTPEYAQHLPSDIQSRIHTTLRGRARLGLPDDSADRCHRAVAYDRWISDGKPDEDVTALASMIVDDRVKLINESLGDLADEVRVGVYGPAVCDAVGLRP